VSKTLFGVIGRPATVAAAIAAAVAATTLAVCVGAGPASATTTTTTTTTTAPATTPSTTVSQADTWLLKAIGAEQKVGSVHIAGTIKQGATNIALSLVVNGDGEGGGTFIQDGSKILMKRVGPLLYFNAPRKFWAAHATKAQTKSYGGKWIEVSALDSRFQSFDQFLDAGDLVAAVFQGHTTPLTLSKPTTFDGHKVLIVSDTVVIKGKRSTGRMYIATKGTPIVYKIIDQSPTEDGTIEFTSYGKPVSISTPPEPINLT
jgi:hypothetical protein